MTVKIVGDELQCPKCQGGHMHHVAIDVVSRREDAPKHRHYRIDVMNEFDRRPDRFDIDDNGTEHGRRGSVGIEFQCEGCGIVSTLNIVQHKGRTLVDW